MPRYVPNRDPDAAWWLSMTDDERVEEIERAHRKEKFNPGAATMHYAFHSVVENQLALKSPDEVAEAMSRLQRDGLTRHDAIHAIASVLVEHIHAILQRDGSRTDIDLPESYRRAVAGLTAEGWRRDSDG